MVTNRAQNAQGGFLLLEVLIAILVFSFGILGIVALQATMVKSSTDARYRSVASFVAEQRVAQMWGDPSNAASYVETDTDISATLPNGTRTVSPLATNQYQVIVRWQLPGEDPHTFTTVAYVTGG